MSKFSNSANKQLAHSNGADLIKYNHNGESLREKAIELHAQGRVVYYENVRPCRKFPNGASFLYEVGKTAY